MSYSLREFVRKTDFTLLRKQKEWLLSVPRPFGQLHPEVDGLIHFLDAVQDMIVDEELASEQRVFGYARNGS